MIPLISDLHVLAFSMLTKVQSFCAEEEDQEKELLVKHLLIDLVA